MALSFWPSFDINGSNAYSQKIFNGLSKLYCFIFENNLDSVSTLDSMFLYSFIIIFAAFIGLLVYTIFEKDQKSLQELRDKVRHSTAVIANIVAVILAIKDIKLNSINYKGCVAINHNKESLMELLKLPEPTPVLIKEVEMEPPPKKKTKKGFKPMKRENSPPQKKEAFPYLKRAKHLANERKPSNSSLSLGGKIQHLNTSLSSPSLREKKIDTARSQDSGKSIKTR